MIDLDALDQQLELAVSAAKAPERPGKAPRPTKTPAKKAPRKDVSAGLVRQKSVSRKPASDKPAAKAVGHGPSAPAKRKPDAKHPAATPPRPVAAPAGDDGASRLTALLELGQFGEAQTEFASLSGGTGAAGDLVRRRDAAAWTTMRAIVEGRADEARRGTESVLDLGRQAGDSQAWERSLVQRYWVLTQWGDDTQRYELLDHCRERAYCFDDLRWRSALTLLLARLGRTDEATTEFDITVERALRQSGHPAPVAVASDLAEASWVLRDSARAAAVEPFLNQSRPFVVSDGGWVFRGALARFQGLAAATAGRVGPAERLLAEAAEAHRRIGAVPLLARTLYELGQTLNGFGASGAPYLAESSALARKLGLSWIPGALTSKFSHSAA